MIAKDTPYIGRTSGPRNTSAKQGGIRCHWSEHVRELQLHMTGNVPKNRARRRYVEMRRGINISCLNIFIYGICDPSSIASREAVAIASVQPVANGMELSHFSETMRPQRTRTAKPRRRLNGSSRRKARSAILRRQADQWGETFNEHDRALTSSYICNLENDFALYTDEKRPQKRQNENYSVYRSKNCTHATNST